MHDLIKLRIHSETVTISVPKCNTFAELKELSNRINNYKRFLTKLFKQKKLWHKLKLEHD